MPDAGHDPVFADLQQCCFNKLRITLEGLDSAVNELIAFSGWLARQSKAMTAIVLALVGLTATSATRGALSKLLEKVIAAEIGGITLGAVEALIGFLLAAAAGIGVGATLAAIQICIEELGLAPQRQPF